jgi:hypothetical protein
MTLCDFVNLSIISAFALHVFFVCVSCSVELPNGKVLCGGNDQCPNGWSCVGASTNDASNTSTNYGHCFKPGSEPSTQAKTHTGAGTDIQNGAGAGTGTAVQAGAGGGTQEKGGTRAGSDASSASTISSACGTGCFIDNTCFRPGETQTGNVCHFCAPERSKTGWTSKEDGFQCLNAQNDCYNPSTCQSGICSANAKPDGTRCNIDYGTCRGDTCDGKGNCATKYLLKGISCDDNKPSTCNDVCDDIGNCKGGPCSGNTGARGSSGNRSPSSGGRGGSKS